MENEMNITNAQYMRYDEDSNVSIIATIDGQVLGVPIDPDNRHYVEIMRQVEAGELTIADAD
jgi:hypothetical protein